MEQVIERRTAHIADINLQLALNTIHARLGQLQCSIEALPIQTPPTSPDNSNQTLSLLPADTLRSAILPHLASAPSLRSSEALSDINEDNEEEPVSTPSLLYNAALASWGDPQVFRSDLAMSWENCTWQTGTYCGLSYEFFTNGPPHAQCFTGVSSRGRRCFAFSKRGLGKLIGQDECYNMNKLSHYATRTRRTAPVYFYFTYLFHFAAHPSLLYDTYANPLPLPHSYLPFAQLP
jgi:hypothetical protein